MSQDDELDRETFYGGEASDDADVDDYELEPPDQEIIAGEKRRAAEAVEQASMKVDVDELYRENTAVTLEDLEAKLKEFKFQFGIKHLLIAMTAVALTIMVGQFILGGWLPLLLVLTFLGLASAFGWVKWQEQVRLKEWQAKRDELYERNKRSQHQ